MRQQRKFGRRVFTVAFFMLVSFLSATAQIKTEMFNGVEVAANEVLVKFNHSATLSGAALERAEATSVADIKKKHDISEERVIGGVGVHLFHSRSLTAAGLIQQIKFRPDVAYVEPNFLGYAIRTPNDPNFSSLYGMQKISAPSAWDITTGNAGVLIGVVDTGIDYTHPDLAANVWSAPSAFNVRFGTQVITCPAGSHGFNAIINSCNPLDDSSEGHGTHVSGTIGAVGNNGIGVVGVNWTTSLISGKWINSTGGGVTSDAINAIDFMLQVKAAFPTAANIRILNNSWRTLDGFSQALLDEINRAAANNVLFVAAAGNDGSNNDIVPVYPASYSASNIISVAATDSGDNLASFSNFGASSVHLGAPGVNILSTLPGNAYGMLSGTSMAAPHVAGAAGLILSACDLDTAGLKSAILGNVDPVSSLAGRTTTGGRLNVNKTLSACLPGGLTSFLDTQFNTLEVFSVASNRHVHELTWSNNGTGWHVNDISGTANAPNVAQRGAITSLSDTVIGALEVYYADINHHVRQLTGGTNPAGWHTFDISGLAGAPNVATDGALIGFVDTFFSQLELYYVGTDQHVHQLTWQNNGAGWHHFDISGMIGAQNVAVGGAVTGFVDTIFGTLEIYYVDTNQHVRQLTWVNNGTGWHTFDLTALSFGPNVASKGALISFADPVLNSLQIYYVDTNQHVRQLSWVNNGTGWHNFDISSPAPNVAVGGALTGFSDPLFASLEVFYIDANQHVRQLNWTNNGTGWHSFDISGLAGAPNAATGGALTSFLDTLLANLEVYYVDTNQHTRQLTWTNNGTGWHTFDIGR